MKQEKKIQFKPPGMRNLKTALCVLICLLTGYLISGEITLYSSVAAIVCMQSTIENTWKIGVNRLVGTAIGGGAGMLLIPIVDNAALIHLYFILMPIGIILIIALCNAIKMPGASVICVIVFITVVASPISPTANDNPYFQALHRIVDTAIGIVIAVVINRFIAPPKLYEDRKMQLVCDTHEDVYNVVAQFLSGTEALILYDTALTNKSKNTFSGSPRIRKSLAPGIRIPAPTEYAEQAEIEAAYISSSYVVLPLELAMCDGYVEIPGNLLPCTVVWQSAEAPTQLPRTLQ